jgi:hypothetical protein
MQLDLPFLVVFKLFFDYSQKCLKELFKKFGLLIMIEIIQMI